MSLSGICTRSTTSPDHAVSTPRPKSLAMMFLSGAFLTGGAVGFAAERAVSPPRPGSVSETTVIDGLARELQLSPDQRVVLDSVWDWRRRESRTIMATVRPSLDAVRDSARVLMMNSLDSAQKTAFRALLERNQRAADSTARARGEIK
jgi:hypothetical protein